MSEQLKVDTSGLDPNRNRELVTVAQEYNARVEEQSVGPSNKTVVTVALVIGVALAAFRALGAENTTGQAGSPNSAPVSDTIERP